MSIFKSLLAVIFLMPGIVFADTKVFVSFSMPEELLIATLKDCERSKIPVYLNGMHENSMPKTIQKIMKLTKEVPNLLLQIDPLEFSSYKIEQVPALVLSTNNCFDVIYGNLQISAAISLIREKGGCK